MDFQGRKIDVIDLWSRWVEFPNGTKIDGEFLPLVFCPNPEHDNTRTPAFQINVEKGLVHCFGRCGISGTYTRAISLIEGISEREARKIILRNSNVGRKSILSKGDATTIRAGGNRGKKRNRAKHESLEYLRYIPEFGQNYLRNIRGISESSVANFEIGWDDEKQRIVIPGKDLSGTTRLLIKRSVKPKDQPKYLYTEGFPKTSLVFGACGLDPGMIRSNGIVLVEGAFDKIKLWQNEITTAVATLGTGLSEIQARIICRFRPPVIYLMFDRDTSGVAGIQDAIRKLPKSCLRVCRYPSERFDPAELTREEAYRSIERAIPVSKLFNPNAREK